MTKSTHIPLSASELSNLWMTYQHQTMQMRFLEHFLEHAEDDEINEMLKKSYDSCGETVDRIINFFHLDGAVIPVGFTERDFIKGTPKLFDFLYEVMFLHMISKIGTSLFSLYSTMSYRQDIRKFYRELTSTYQMEFDLSAQFLLEKGVLARPPYVTMPQKVSFVEDTNYLSGLNIFKEKRSLNTVELSLIHHAIETNLTGMQLMMGFAQVARDEKVKEYFVKGMKLSKEVETTLGEYLRRDYIEPPATHAGKATNSTTPPFSDKIMMYITSLLSTFGLGSHALGGAFSLRSDLPLTMAKLAQQIFSFAKEGGEIMIKNGWMEEPPQVEDRQQLTKPGR
ncbi:DUF3231 family protein [Evansella tamaricis]|uniref:DUF3231 family protein n=1 Tax=Evansella tamaricis TaxID=2069301 RepID=A0ABS6JJL8_9BACI|nr:DUF3231 family protein [Evansella tamaricis]